MLLFSGEHECKMDPKNRLVLPAKIKAALLEISGNQIVIGRGFEPCLILYPQAEYDKVAAKVGALNQFDPEQRKFQRNFLMRNTPAEFDGNGRFLINKRMLEHARLGNAGRDILLIGAGNRLEIWQPEVFDSEFFAEETEFSTLAQKFLGGQSEETAL